MTTPPMPARDYTLTGAQAQRAIDSGLAAAEWYHSDIPRKQMKALMQRSDQPAIRDTLVLFGAMALLAGVGIALWPSWWGLPVWLAYGVLYGSAMDARWHECGHGTTFRTAWMNDAVYQVASFCMIRNPVTWRWSHARHHTDTIIVGRDPEIAIMRPTEFARLLANTVGLIDAWVGWRRMLYNAAWGPTPDEASYIPETERPRVTRVARIWVAVYAATLLAAVATGSILPLMVIGLPRLYGAWHGILTGLLQHGGLAEDVTDHRLNSRTVLMNPVSRFIYWNMNYHVEHHMFPMVPYHRLPDLHALIAHDLPAPSPSILAAYREMWPVLVRQMRDEAHYLRRTLPATARPYQDRFHTAALGDAVPA